MSSLHSAVWCALGLAALCGCARDARITDPSSTDVPFESGPLSGTTLGLLGAPQTTTSSGATLTGLVGTFTSLATVGEGEDGAATVYFSSSNPRSVWQVRTDGTGLQKILPDSIQGFGPSISPSGSRLLFWVRGNSASPAEAQLLERLPDGTTRQLTADLHAATPVSWTPDESGVIYPVHSQDPPFPALIRRFSFSGGAPQDLIAREPARSVPRLTVGRVSGSPVVIHEKQDRGLYRLDLATGLDNPYVTPADSEIVSSPDLSRSDNRLLFTVTRPVGNGINRSQLRVAEVNNPSASTALPFRKDSRDNYNDEAHWLQDGTGIVAWAWGPPYNAQLVLLNPQGQYIRTLTSLPQGVERGFSVGPSRPASQVLIGEGGLLGSTASGIIFGQGRERALTAVLAFHSDLPGTVALTANTGLNATAPTLTYTLVAEQLRTLRFINSLPGGVLTTAMDSSMVAAGGALITFDADDGTVALVLLFAESERGAASVTESGGTRVFRGDFLGAWSGGRNLAPGGAREVRLESATGRVSVTP